MGSLSKGDLAVHLAYMITVFLLASAAAGPAFGYEEGEVREGGRLTGIVKFIGEPPKLAPVPVKKNQDVCGPQKPSEALVLGANKGVQHTVVYLEGITKGKKADLTDLALDNARCVFVPHVVAVMVEPQAVIRNSDPILHNTHGFQDKTTVFNLALPIQHQTINIKGRLKKPGVVRILCDAHTHMWAWIVVRDNPYYAVTNEAGRFMIDNIPSGKYKVVAWHEGWRPTGRDKDGRVTYESPRMIAKEVVIPAKGEAAVEFEIQ